MAPHHHIHRAGTELAPSRGGRRTHIHLRNRLLAIFWITVVADVIATGVVWVTEHGPPGSQIHDLFDAFLFSTSALAGSFGAFFHRWGREQDAEKARRLAAAGRSPA